MTVGRALKKHSVAYREEIIPARYRQKNAKGIMDIVMADQEVFIVMQKWIGISMFSDAVFKIGLQHREKMFEELIESITSAM